MKAFKRITAIALVALLTMALMAGCQSTNNGTAPNKISTLEEEKGKTLRSATFTLYHDCSYVRFVVIDKYGKKATTNAYFVDDILSE